MALRLVHDGTGDHRPLRHPAGKLVEPLAVGLALQDGFRWPRGGYGVGVTMNALSIPHVHGGIWSAGATGRATVPSALLRQASYLATLGGAIGARAKAELPYLRQEAAEIRARSTGDWFEKPQVSAPESPLEELPRHDHALDLMGALVDLGDPASEGSFRG
jgi:hypothetical protein